MRFLQVVCGARTENESNEDPVFSRCDPKLVDHLELKSVARLDVTLGVQQFGGGGSCNVSDEPSGDNEVADTHHSLADVFFFFANCVECDLVPFTTTRRCYGMGRIEARFSTRSSWCFFRTQLHRMIALADSGLVVRFLG